MCLLLRCVVVDRSQLKKGVCGASRSDLRVGDSRKPAGFRERRVWRLDSLYVYRGGQLQYTIHGSQVLLEVGEEQSKALAGALILSKYIGKRVVS
jgi:hypothetical protein